MSAARRSPPSPGASPSFDFPEVARSQLANGLELRLCRLSRLPVVSATLFMRAGEQHLPEERAGLAVLVGNALDGGTARRSGAEMAEALERLGARVSVRTGWEGSSVSLGCVSERFGDALSLLAEMVREPSFPAAEVERVKGQQLALISQRDRDPSAMASVEASKRYYAAGSPFARPLSGVAGSVGGLTPELAEELVGSRYRPRGSALVVVGEIEPGAASELAAERFGAWSGETPAAGGLAAEPALRERRIWVVDRPGSVQSELRAGHVGVSIRTPDHFPLLVGNLVLGGMFTSRLNLSLREKHGFTYGVRSRFAMRSLPGPFEVSTSVGREVTAPAVREILSELDSFVEGGPSEEEAEAARAFAVGAFGLGLETTSQIAGRLTFGFARRLPEDHYPRYRERIGAVTRGEIRAAVRRALRPEELQIIVVGDAAEIAAPLERLGAGEVRVVESGGARREG